MSEQPFFACQPDLQGLALNGDFRVCRAREKCLSELPGGLFCITAL
jgi:hypothetical protein